MGILILGPSAKKQRMMGLGGKNLLQIYRERLEREASKKHAEFAGRRNLGEIAKLYIKMEAVKQEEVAQEKLFAILLKFIQQGPEKTQQFDKTPHLAHPEQ